MRRFEHLDVPYQWEEYWTKYPHGYSIFEALSKWVTQVDDMVDNINEWNTYLEGFVEQFDKDLQNNVISILKEWQESGFLDVVIDHALQTQIDKVENTVKENKKTLLDWVNVKNIGARGDGITDDTSVLQFAINNYKTIYLPEGIYMVSGKNILKLRNGVTIIGENSNTVIKVTEDNGDWAYLFYTDSNILAENITIENITLDCNIKNTSLTGTSGWNGTGRVLWFIEEGKNIKVKNCNMVTNGFWAIRGKTSDSEYIGNKILFDPTTYPHRMFDSSCIWVGGERNKIKNNTIKSKEKIIDGWWVFTGYTAIENQGHDNIIDSNIVNNYRTGVIITCSSGYENEKLIIEQLGNFNTRITNNVFKVHSRGINIWTMGVPRPSVIRDLVIANNTIVLRRHNKNIPITAINIYEGDPDNYGALADGKQTGEINGLSICNNTIRCEVREVSEFIYSLGDHCFDFKATIKIENVIISENIIQNFGGYGGLFSSIQLFDSNGNMVENNPNWIKNVVIENNNFINTFYPLRIERNTDFFTIKSNTFSQTELFDLGNNMTETIFIRGGFEHTKIMITDNKVMVPKPLKPYVPDRHLIGIDDNVYVDNSQACVYEEYPSAKITLNNIQYVRKLNGVLYKAGSYFGATVGSMPSVTITNAGSNFINVTDTENIESGDVLKVLTTGILKINSMTVKSVEYNKVTFYDNIVFEESKTPSDLVGLEVSYSNNIVEV